MNPKIIFLALGAAALAKAEQAPERIVPQPQPRVRLVPSAQGSVARVEKTESAPTPVMLEKVVVTGSKLPQRPADEGPEDPKHFSVTGGGTLYRGKIGEAPVSIGLWPYFDLFGEDARFKGEKTRVDLEFVRVKL